MGSFWREDRWSGYADGELPTADHAALDAKLVKPKYRVELALLERCRRKLACLPAAVPTEEQRQQWTRCLADLKPAPTSIRVGDAHSQFLEDLLCRPEVVIDAYADDILTPDQRRHVDQQLLSHDHHRRQLQLTEQLRSALHRLPRQSAPTAALDLAWARIDEVQDEQGETDLPMTGLPRLSAPTGLLDSVLDRLRQETEVGARPTWMRSDEPERRRQRMHSGWKLGAMVGCLLAMLALRFSMPLTAPTKTPIDTLREFEPIASLPSVTPPMPASAVPAPVQPVFPAPPDPVAEPEPVVVAGAPFELKHAVAALDGAALHLHTPDVDAVLDRWTYILINHDLATTDLLEKSTGEGEVSKLEIVAPAATLQRVFDDFAHADRVSPKLAGHAVVLAPAPLPTSAVKNPVVVVSKLKLDGPLARPLPQSADGKFGASGASITRNRSLPVTAPVEPKAGLTPVEPVKPALIRLTIQIEPTVQRRSEFND